MLINPISAWKFTRNNAPLHVLLTFQVKSYAVCNLTKNSTLHTFVYTPHTIKNTCRGELFLVKLLEFY